MYGYLALLMIQSVSGSARRVGNIVGSPPASDTDLSWLWPPLLVSLAVIAGLAVITELGILVNRRRGQSPKPAAKRLLYSVHFDGGPAGAAAIRITSDMATLVEQLRFEVREAYRSILAPEIIGQQAAQSELLLTATEDLLAALGSPLASPALHIQLRSVRDLLRRHPYTRFARIVHTPHPGPVNPPMATADKASPDRHVGFPVIIRRGG